MSLSHIMNLIPNLKTKCYLELGVAWGGTFAPIVAKEKTSVDIAWEPTYKMTTDEFFSTVGANMFFDVIYIDACHEYEYVLNDYNNSVKHLSPNGIIAIHDLLPPIEADTVPLRCGDGYKLLYHIIKDTKIKSYTYESSFFLGLTFFIDPKVVYPDATNKQIEYVVFKEYLKNIKLYSEEEMKIIIRGLL